MNEKPKILPVEKEISWENWLLEVQLQLEQRGYRKFRQNHKESDFTYWKIIKERDTKIYQVGIAFYDFRKFNQENSQYVGILLECMLLGVGRVDMSVSLDITLETFEEMCKDFYNAMNKYNVEEDTELYKEG